METESLENFRPNPRNPRTISKHDFDALIASIREFGDLSGIVQNVTTGQLVGGHQRIQAFKRLGGQPVVLEQFTMPNSVGTIALGYVLLGDEKFPFRRVQWDLKREEAANIAANRITGEFNLDLLAEINYDLKDSPELLALTGQTQEELDKLLEMVGGAGDTPAPHENSLTIRIECESQEQMDQLYTELRDRGLNVRI